MQILDPAHAAIFAELVRRSPLRPVSAAEPLEGRFVRVPVKGRTYWYFDGPVGSGPRRYVGPQDDPQISARVADFAEAKADTKARRRLVAVLLRDARLKAPDPQLGEIVTALAETGLFEAGAVWIGRAAFACYPGLLGIRLPDGLSRLKDGPAALRVPLVFASEGPVPPLLDALRLRDPSFRQVPHQVEGRHVTAFASAAGFRILLLAANHRAAEAMPVPAGAAPAQPLRLLDMLIRNPVRSVLLHRSGLAVSVPAPGRYAVHRFILSLRRRTEDWGVRDRDVRQADLLVEALALAGRGGDLGRAYAEVSALGEPWRNDLMQGIGRLVPSRAAEIRAAMTEGLHEAARALG